MELEKFLEKVLDKTIFKETVKIQVPDYGACDLCGGSGALNVEKTKLKVSCTKCGGSGKTETKKKKKVEGKVLYVPVAFEENKERVLFVSTSYYEEGKPVNVSVKVEDIFIENKIEDKQRS